MRPDREPDRAALADALARVAVLEARLAEVAGRDPLTGLLTLARLRTQLDIECGRAKRHGRPLGLAVLDVDGFRALNGHYGFATGDRVLTAIAAALEEQLRGHDLGARSSADEFIVVLPETDLLGARAALERVSDTLAQTRLDRVDGISVSIGIATFIAANEPADLMAAATSALARARSEGGARVATASQGNGVVSSAQRDAIEALAVALLERDRYTGEHSDTVTGLVSRVAQNLGLTPQDVERVQTAALLHDIGKVAIPDEILHKPAKLTDDEFEVMKTHTVIGERILQAIPGLGGVARIVRHEHERWDGHGYPDGISGETIPVGSRIILACDAYHAMVSDRPYRAAMDHGDAIGELSRHAGTQFDPTVIEILIGCLYGARQSRSAAGRPAGGTIRTSGRAGNALEDLGADVEVGVNLADVV